MTTNYITIEEARAILWNEFSWISDEQINNLIIMLSSIIDNVLDTALNHRYYSHDNKN